MLLIGSRATRFHYPEFRKPKDYDFIATRDEVASFLKNRKHKINSSHEKKIRAKVKIDKEIIQFEFDLTDSYKSNVLLHEQENVFEMLDEKLDYSYRIADPGILFVLKKSHIIFPIHWQKNINDYLFLKERLFNPKANTLKALNEYEVLVLDLRRAEIKNRFKSKTRSFDVDNSDFFKKSEKFVNRKVEHDSIHYATCFYDKPLFLSVKEDTSKAALSEKLVDNLSFDDKVKLIQEEAMVLSLERYIIPALLKKKLYDSNQAYNKTAGKMVYNYLPDFLKDFGADNFDKVLDLSKDYVTEFLFRHKTFTAKILK